MISCKSIYSQRFFPQYQIPSIRSTETIVLLMHFDNHFLPWSIRPFWRDCVSKPSVTVPVFDGLPMIWSGKSAAGDRYSATSIAFWISSCCWGLPKTFLMRSSDILHHCPCEGEDWTVTLSHPVHGCFLGALCNRTRKNYKNRWAANVFRTLRVTKDAILLVMGH